MCVCVCVCVCMNGCVLECHPFTIVSFSCIMTELLNGFHIFSKLCSVTDTVVHRCMCKCVCVRLCVSGCIYIILFSALWPICRLYTQKFSEFCVFVDFPLISYGQSFLTEEHKCDYFFYEHLAIFLCVHTPNATKVIKFLNIPMKL